MTIKNKDPLVSTPSLTSDLEYESNVRYYSRHFDDTFTHGKGSFLYGGNRKTYIDFFSGAGALNYGHNHPIFKEALLDYIRNDCIIHGLDMRTPSHMNFLKDFNDIILKKRNLNYKIQFTGPTGTNAVEAALKLARKYTGRKNICYFSNSYHGMTLGSLSVSDAVKRKENLHISFPHTLIAPYDSPLETELSLAHLRKMIHNLESEEIPAAFILETIQGEGGINVASEQWLKGVVKIAEEFDILIIIDDIQVGCGRTGSFFSFENFNLYPDIICLSKSISGFGLPLAILLMKPSLDVWDPGEHNGTFRCNNLSLVTACIALTFWENNELQESTQEKAFLLKEHLEDLARKYPKEGSHVKGRGLIQGIGWSNDKIASLISKLAFQEGLVIETAGKHSQVLKILPALTIPKDTLVDGLKILDHCMKKILA